MIDNQKVWLYRAFQSILLAAVLYMQYVIVKEVYSTKTAEMIEYSDVEQVN